MVAFVDSFTSTVTTATRAPAPSQRRIASSKQLTAPQETYIATKTLSANCNRLVSCSRDPIGYLGGQNFYRYVSSSPPGRVDPLGLEYLRCDLLRVGKRIIDLIIDPEKPDEIRSIPRLYCEMKCFCPGDIVGTYMDPDFPINDKWTYLDMRAKCFEHMEEARKKGDCKCPRRRKVLVRPPVRSPVVLPVIDRPAKPFEKPEKLPEHWPEDPVGGPILGPLGPLGPVLRPVAPVVEPRWWWSLPTRVFFPPVWLGPPDFGNAA